MSKIGQKYETIMDPTTPENKEALANKRNERIFDKIVEQNPYVRR